MKKRTWIITAAVALIALVATPFLVADPRGPMHGRNHDVAMVGAILGHLSEKLDLSEPQKDEIKSILRDLREENAAYRDQLRGGIHDAFAKLVENPSDIAAAQAILDQQTQAESAMKKNVLNATAKALNVLTPEQRTKLATLVSEHAARRRDRS